jgi:glycosyltransferase involved in cell wall biosynthesis
MPRILLVTWTPPGDGNVGEIILRDLCEMLPPGSLHVIEVSNFAERPAAYPGLRLVSPDERPWRPLPGRIGGLMNHLRVRSRFRREADRLVGVIAEYAKQHAIDRIWLTLSSQTLIRVGRSLTRAAGIPVLNLVWDPPDWLAMHLGWDRASVAWTLDNFDAAMRASAGAMVVSENMVAEYEGRYSIPATIVRHAFALEQTMRSRGPREDGEFRIGFAGTMYDQAQLDCLIGALNLLEWRIGSRPVVLRMVGNFYRFTKLARPVRVELLGWRGTDETRALISDCDIAYLPISFRPSFSEFARLAYPTKLSTYLAAGTPVIVHAPPNSAPIGLCKMRGFGSVCTSMQAGDLADSLREAADERVASARAQAVAATCVEMFSRPVMRRQFARFLGIEESLLGE